jgi:hypothetical protein
MMIAREDEEERVRFFPKNLTKRGSKVGFIASSR